MPPTRAALACLATLSSGCALSLSEARPARVLERGEVSVAVAGNAVVAPGILGDVVDQGRAAAEWVLAGGELSDEQRHVLVRSGLAIALLGPGAGLHVDAALGLGLGFDAAARVGNGVYAFSARRALPCERWQCSAGVRVAYGSGATVIPYVDVIDTVADVGLRRLDAQLTLQMGREHGEWLRWWLGLKGVASGYRLSLAAPRAGIDGLEIRDRMRYVGGFGGIAMGFRWAYFVLELGVYRADGDLVALGDDIELGGTVLAPTVAIEGRY